MAEGVGWHAADHPALTLVWVLIHAAMVAPAKPFGNTKEIGSSDCRVGVAKAKFGMQSSVA
jgi:hypothetical protein